MARHLLTDARVRTAKPKAKVYRLADGDGLYLFVPPSGVRSWQYRYRLGGKETIATLGKVTDVQGLAWARGKADEARAVASEGRNVATEKRVERAGRVAAQAVTFKATADDWVRAETRRTKWTPDYKREVTASLTNHLADLNALPIADINAKIAVPILRRLERAAPDMASKVRQRLRAILDHAAEAGAITHNPIPMARRGPKRDRKHYPAVLDREAVGEILRAADRSDVTRGVRRAHTLAAFTVQRVGEIVPAKWAEIDLKAGTWSIPRDRMKRKEVERGPHVVPLPPALLELLREWRRVDGAGAYVCPAPRGDGHITREAVEKFYRRGLELASKHSPHSWRSVFSTWARDDGQNGDVVESQLDHVVGNKVAASYDRAKRLEMRRELMRWYERQLIAARDGADIVRLKEA